MLERALLALGCGYVLAELLALLLYAMVRPLSTGQILAGAVALNGVLLLAVLARHRRARGAGDHPSDATGFSRWSGAVLVLLLAAAPPRLWNLGYSELQGDEAKVVLRAMAVLQGVPDALIAHRKPPGEVLLGALFAGGLGVVTELAARLHRRRMRRCRSVADHSPLRVAYGRGTLAPRKPSDSSLRVFSSGGMRYTRAYSSPLTRATKSGGPLSTSAWRRLAPIRRCSMFT